EAVDAEAGAGGAFEHGRTGCVDGDGNGDVLVGQMGGNGVGCGAPLIGDSQANRDDAVRAEVVHDGLRFFEVIDTAAVGVDDNELTAQAGDGHRRAVDPAGDRKL